MIHRGMVCCNIWIVVLLVGTYALSAATITAAAEGPVRRSQTTRKLQDEITACIAAPCALIAHCRRPEDNTCGNGPLFCNEQSIWNNTGCTGLEVPTIPADPLSNSTEVASGSGSNAGAAVGGALGTLGILGIAFVIAQRNGLVSKSWTASLPSLRASLLPAMFNSRSRATTWTSEEISALQRAYEFTKDFESLCKAVPTKTPAEIAIKLKHILQPKTIFARASLLLFSTRESNQSFSKPYKPKIAPSNMKSNKPSFFLTLPKGGLARIRDYGSSMIFAQAPTQSSALSQPMTPASMEPYLNPISTEAAQNGSKTSFFLTLPKGGFNRIREFGSSMIFARGPIQPTIPLQQPQPPMMSYSAQSPAPSGAYRLPGMSSAIPEYSQSYSGYNKGGATFSMQASRNPMYNGSYT